MGTMRPHKTPKLRARGRASDGSSEAARAAAYPPLFNAAILGLLFSEADALRAVCNGRAAVALHDAVLVERVSNQCAAREHGSGGLGSVGISGCWSGVGRSASDMDCGAGSDATVMAGAR